MRKQAVEIQQKTLTVVLMEGDSEKAELYNSMIKEAISDYWVFNDSIEYISFKNYKKLRRKRNSEKAYLVYKNKLYDNTIGNPKFKMALALNSYNNRKDRFITYFSFSTKSTSEDFKNKVQSLQNMVKSMAMQIPK
jgi:hypothetical protein